MEFVFWAELEVQMSLRALRHGNEKTLIMRAIWRYLDTRAQSASARVNTNSYSATFLEMMSYRAVQHSNGKGI
eukprot:6877386-Pyramimonas_sp.AAC.1